MKKNILLLLLLLFISAGCKKIMHDEETAISKIGSVEQMDEALTGIYSRLTQYMNYGGGQNYGGEQMRWGGSTGKPVESGDDFRSGNNSSYYYDFYHDDGCKYTSPGTVYSAPLDSVYIRAIWQNLYNTVVNTNNVICQFEKQEEVRNELKTGLGEAYLMRAYTYFRLVRIFGEIPLIKNVDVNFTLTKSSFKEIYSLIESDLLRAVSLLPANRASARIPGETPHRGTAKAILAEVYLNMGGYPLKDESMYRKAAKVAGEVIDSAAFFGYNLMADYAELWNGKHKINEETVFGLYFIVQKPGRDGWWDRELNNNISRYHNSNGLQLLWSIFAPGYLRGN